MKKRIFLAALIAAAIIISACDNGNGPSDEKGTLYVISDPTGASIFIDGTLQTGRITNASFELDPGNYFVRVAKTGFDASPESIAVTILADQTDTAQFDLLPIADTGYIIVICHEDAPVLIDGVPSGFSNEPIEVGAGSRSVKVGGWAFRSIAENVVVASGETLEVVITPSFVTTCLIEEFSHVNCSNCPDAAAAVQSVLASYGDTVLAIEWHPNLAGIDPFRADNPTMHDGRGAYYGVSGMPAVFVAGNPVPDPTSASAIGSYTANALSNAEVQRFKLWARVMTGNTVRVNYNVLSGTGTGVFKLAVVENSRHFSTPPGANGMTDFHNIARRMTTYPTFGTITISAGMGNFEMEYELPADLAPGDFHIVVWFQNDEDGVFSVGESILCSPCRAEF